MGITITINDLDPMTLQRLESEARRRGIDMGTLARDVLRQALPPVGGQLDRGAASQLHHDLDHLAGTWSEADAREFAAAVEPFGRIDAELWK